jgi:hypothetical protein
MDVTNTVTKTDIDRIEASLKKLIKATKKNKIQNEYFELLNQLNKSFNGLRLMVEFDHEKRLQAIEDFLQNQ